jgi:hypothetical protein
MTLINSFTGVRNRFIYGSLNAGRETILPRDSVVAFVHRASGGPRRKGHDREYLKLIGEDFDEARAGSRSFHVAFRRPARWKMRVGLLSVDLMLQPHYRGRLIDCVVPSRKSPASAVLRMDQGSFSVRFGVLQRGIVKVATWVTDVEVPDFSRARYFLNLNPNYFQLFGVGESGELVALSSLLKQANSRRVRLEKLSADERRLYDRFVTAIRTDHERESGVAALLPRSSPPFRE